MLAWQQGDNRRAVVLCQKGVAMSRKLGDTENIVYFRTVMGEIAVHQGDSGQAAMLLEDNLILCRKLDNEWLLGWALAKVGDVARDQGEYDRSAALHSESLTLFQKTGDRFRIAYALRNLGIVALYQANHKQAAAFFRESLTLSKELGDRWVAEGCLEGLAGAAALKRQHEHAARLFAAAEALRASLGRHRSIADQADFDKRVASTRAGLGDAAFATAWTQGSNMPLEEATKAALAPTESLPAGTAKSPFTLREREVVALVAQGLTNREIASRLVISERTADTHVQHILNKLGVSSRVQVAAWAVEHGLHALSPN
jgi:non-specific serine/threonine protein kinase